MVVAEHSPRPGQDVVLQLAGLVQLAQRIQGEGQVAQGPQGVGVVVAEVQVGQVRDGAAPLIGIEAAGEGSRRALWGVCSASVEAAEVPQQQVAVAAGRDDTLLMLTGIRLEIDGPRLTPAWSP